VEIRVHGAIGAARGWQNSSILSAGSALLQRSTRRAPDTLGDRRKQPTDSRLLIRPVKKTSGKNVSLQIPATARAGARGRLASVDIGR
jgi:hypothetical protein